MTAGKEMKFEKSDSHMQDPACINSCIRCLHWAQKTQDTIDVTRYLVNCLASPNDDAQTWFCSTASLHVTANWHFTCPVQQTPVPLRLLGKTDSPADRSSELVQTWRPAWQRPCRKLRLRGSRGSLFRHSLNKTQYAQPVSHTFDPIQNVQPTV
jgi:hypothetical protein